MIQMTPELERLERRLRHYYDKLFQHCFREEVVFYEEQIRKVQYQIESLVLEQLEQEEVI